MVVFSSSKWTYFALKSLLFARRRRSMPPPVKVDAPPPQTTERRRRCLPESVLRQATASVLSWVVETFWWWCCWWRRLSAAVSVRLLQLVVRVVEPTLMHWLLWKINWVKLSPCPPWRQLMWCRLIVHSSHPVHLSRRQLRRVDLNAGAF